MILFVFVMLTFDDAYVYDDCDGHSCAHVRNVVGCFPTHVPTCLEPQLLHAFVTRIVLQGIPGQTRVERELYCAAT